MTERRESGKAKGHRPLTQVPAVAQGLGKQRELCEQDPFFEETVAYCILQVVRSKDPGYWLMIGENIKDKCSITCNFDLFLRGALSS